MGRSLRIVLILTLTLTIASCTAGTESAAVKAADIPRAVEKVHRFALEQKQVQRNIQSVGSLFPLEEVAVSSEVEGRVESVLVDVGDRVTAGQALVNISPVELSLSLAQAKAIYEQARARLGLTESAQDLKNVADAAEVKKALADLTEAEQNHKRAQQLMDKGVLAKQDFDDVDARFRSARAAYDLAVQSVQDLRAQLPQYRAAVELAEKKLRDATIRAPFTGEIKERTVAPGQYLKVQTPVFTIVSTQPLRVRLKVPERMAGWVGVNDPVTITVDAYGDEPFSGKISRINPSVDSENRTFEVEALIDNSSGRLKPGFFVKAAIPAQRADSVLIVPEASLSYSYGVYKVFLLQGNTLKEKEVKIGDRFGDGIEIVEGLSAGDVLGVPIAESQVLKEGMKVEVTP